VLVRALNFCVARKNVSVQVCALNSDTARKNVCVQENALNLVVHSVHTNNKVCTVCTHIIMVCMVCTVLDERRENCWCVRNVSICGYVTVLLMMRAEN
jgi:hypothetical protein